MDYVSLYLLQYNFPFFLLKSNTDGLQVNTWFYVKMNIHVMFLKL
jgi:hypothetical protein